MKRIISLILVALMVLSVAASCKKSKSKSPSSSSSVSQGFTPGGSSSGTGNTPGGSTGNSSGNGSGNSSGGNSSGGGLIEEVTPPPADMQGSQVTASGFSFEDYRETTSDYNKNLFYYNELKFEVADPSVIYIDDETDTENYGYFYCYGTSDQIGCHGFQAWRSKDLANWEDMGAVYMPDFTNSWAYTNYWAPEIIYDEEGMEIGGETYNYFLFFNAEMYTDEINFVNNETGETPYIYMSVLYSKKPNGPFYHPDNIQNGNGETLSVNAPVFDFSYNNTAITDRKLGSDKTIDASPFIDSDGTKYMYYSGYDYHEGKFDGNWNDPTIGSGLEDPKEQSIYGVKMIDWFTPDYSTLTQITEVSHKTVGGEKVDWEGDDSEWNVNEGPFMYKDPQTGTYMLTFSVYHFQTTKYQVRLATSTSALGNFTKIAPNQGGTVIKTVAQWDGVVQSTGHHCFITVGDELFIAYHTFKSRTDITQGRALALDRVNVKNYNGNTIFVTNGPSYSYQPLPSALSGYDNVASQATITGDILGNASELTDGLVKYHESIEIGNVANEVEIAANGKITIDFGNNYHNVRAILLQLSSEYEGSFNRISNATLTYKSTNGDKKVEITNAQYDINKFYNFDVSIAKQAGGTAIIEFADLPVKKIELTFDSWGLNFKLNEIEVLANTINTNITPVSDAKLTETYQYTNALVPIAIKRNQAETIGSVRLSNVDLHTTFGVDLSHDDGSEDGYIQTFGPWEQYAYLKGVATDTIYFEAEISVYELQSYLDDKYPKLGIIVKNLSGCTFLYVDAADNYNNKVVGYVQQQMGTGGTWDWENTEALTNTPAITYKNGNKFVKLGMARVGGDFYFYCNDMLLFSSKELRGLPEGRDAAYGFLCFNTGMTVRNISYTLDLEEINAIIAERHIESDYSNKNFTPVTSEEGIDGGTGLPKTFYTATSWNVNNDYVESNPNYANRKVTLSATNSSDNFLFFNGANATTMYVEATFKVVGGTLEGTMWDPNTETWVPLYEPFGKFGLMFRDSNNKGIFFYPNAATDINDRVSTVEEMKYNDVKYAFLHDASNWSWDVATAANQFDATKPITLGIFRQGDLFKLLVNGEVVFVTTLDVTEEIYPALFSFNIGLEVTDYRATSDANDEMIKKLKEDISAGNQNYGAAGLIESWGSWKYYGNTVINNGANGLEATGYKSISGTDLYFEATYNLQGANNDEWSKVGLTFRNSTVESYYHIDAINNGWVDANDNGIEEDGERIPFGHNNAVGVVHNWDWDTRQLARLDGLDYARVKLAILYSDGVMYYIVNDMVAMVQTGKAGLGANDSINVGLMTTNVNFVAYNIYGTTNATELNALKAKYGITTQVAIDGNLSDWTGSKTNAYEAWESGEVEGNQADGNGFSVMAFMGQEGIYVGYKAIVDNVNILNLDSKDWWFNTNVEMAFYNAEGKSTQVFVALNGHIKDVLNYAVTTEQRQDGKFDVTVELLISYESVGYTGEEEYVAGFFAFRPGNYNGVADLGVNVNGDNKMNDWWCGTTGLYDGISYETAQTAYKITANGIVFAE